VTELATFLDREPYIWFWRPTYRVFGSLIRECKVLISGAERTEPDYESRIARIEAAQRQTSELLEQVLITVLADRQVPRAMEEMQAIFASALSKHAAEVSATNAAQWAAIEQLILALMGNSDRCQTAGNNDHASNLASPTSVDKVA
jgi:hypothetical protein